MSFVKKIKQNHFVKHETKRRVLIKFLLLLAVLVGYFGFLTFKYGLKDGFSVTLLTWSFFVFCTPIADAGFLVDFPIRLITKLKMVYSEVFVWILALLINLYALFLNPGLYEKTGLLKIFKQILENPYPFWSIILLSAFGTFLSIYFGDELVDTIKHRHRKKYIKHKRKHQFVMVGFVMLIAAIIFTYTSLIQNLGISVSQLV